MPTVALLVFPGVQALDVFGPTDVFSEANRLLAPEAQYQLELIATERDTVRCSSGLRIGADRHFDEARGHCDLLLVAGGPSLVEQPLADAAHAWLREASARARRFGSICNGALTLGRAGLLDGRTVTTHWNDAAALAAMCPTANVEFDRIFIQDGNLYTSAGVTAGIDLSLYLLAQDHGPEIALNVARRLVVFVQRAGGQSQFSPYLTPYAEATSPIAQVQQHVLGHLNEDLSVEVLAGIAKMSKRNFARIFVRDTHVTPAEFVESARIDAARVMLENSTAPLKTVAFRCGMRDADHLRVAFKRKLGTTPQQYRAHFSAVTARAKRPAKADT
ncbi:GlxA family transcriptional regulator [Paraburkholderia silvatlantica]|uniref:AraC family transcriptional regulator with amidase-like domain n=1 Tax=Paraburkholderia silvatlantica TaxID=321895 RepID=A0A2V4THB0_9BURK|nr:GlxA family transcriptional regulator [Paraburkholderia silvatlantica]PYE24929.1 AraC family transcriptional regulator with amidase-like domain [Paraburkholderia silvatlantica]TDR05123.1 AraC family transcriptional regulator with amidase-like domain [Paraburkholderia silvatlantica]